jgi:hypothetical protein
MAPDDETIEFRVIGEQRDDSGHLLLLGADGRFYRYTTCCCELAPVEPDDTCVIDPIIAGDPRIIVPGSGSTVDIP